MPVEMLMPEPFRERHQQHRTQYASSPHTRPMGTGMSLLGRRKDGTEFPRRDKPQLHTLRCRAPHHQLHPRRERPPAHRASVTRERRAQPIRPRLARLLHRRLGRSGYRDRRKRYMEALRRRERSANGLAQSDAGRGRLKAIDGLQGLRRTSHCMRIAASRPCSTDLSRGSHSNMLPGRHRRIDGSCSRSRLFRASAEAPSSTTPTSASVSGSRWSCRLPPNRPGWPTLTPVMMLAASAEAHDHSTGLHLRNVQVLTEALARELGHSEESAGEIDLAAVLHDIGKIRVPKAILLSPDELSPTEWAVVKQHTIWGAEFLSGRPAFELAATVARHHHERWDGQGYPEALTGDDIPEEAAIVAVADAFDAMTHDRPYRRLLPSRKRSGVSSPVREAIQPEGRTQPSSACTAKTTRIADVVRIATKPRREVITCPHSVPPRRSLTTGRS